MEYVDIIVTKICRGSENGIVVKTFHPSPVPQQVEKKLARVFIAQGWAVPAASGKPGPLETKVVVPETKVVFPEKAKKPSVKIEDRAHDNRK